jgi:oligopeptidase B
MQAPVDSNGRDRWREVLPHRPGIKVEAVVPVEDPGIYQAMASYSPYDNVIDAPYPAILATAGLSDPRVSYWEPAKWVQRVRRHSTSGRPVLLKVDLGAGHGGPSGRYEAWAEEAFVYAFLLDQTSKRP